MACKAKKQLIRILAVLVLIFNTLGVMPARAATITISESFQNATAPGWTLLGDATLTEAEGGVDAGGAADGWLRLTNNDTALVGAAIYGTAIRSDYPFDVQFDYAVYGYGPDAGSDGVAFYMLDGSTTPSLGGGGGNLGYVGTTGAYFGVGFSEYGDDQVKIWGPSSATPLVTVNTNPTNLLHTDGRDARHIRITFSTGHISVWVAGVQVINNFDISAITAPATVKLGLSGATGGFYNVHEIRNFVATYESDLVVTINPASKDFGAWNLGTSSAAQEFTLTNDGKQDLTLGVLNLAGSDAGNFQLTATACNSVTLAPKASCSFFVTYAPVEIGARSATVSIPSSAFTSPDSVTVSGTAYCKDAITVTSNADGGAGSLRRAITNVCSGGTITFDDDRTIPLVSELAISKDLTIDGAGHKITVSGNDATRVFNVSAGQVTLNDLTIADGNVTTTDCGSSSALCGGGIMLQNGGETVTVTNSTFTGNHANFGGGIYNEATLIVANSTFSGNSANYGGGVATAITMTVTNTTFSGNSAAFNGGGINNIGTLNMINTILANSLGGSDCYKTGGTVTGDHNIIEADSPVKPCGTTVPINSDPFLADSLADNNGVTQTFALLPGSPAVDAGDNAACAASPVSGKDQRGVPRPAGACDIGAYEIHYTGIYYVKQTPGGTMNCQSWVNACGLQSALFDAIGGDEIWVAKGVYKPGTLQADTFQLKNGVKVYGGFPDTGTPVFTDRDPATHLTILSGDIDNNDTQTPIVTDAATETNNGSNSYHVVTGASNATLDGFTITAGHAWGTAGASSCGQRCGGGLYDSGVDGLTLTGVTLSGNSADIGGGGMFDENSNFTLTDVTFTGNKAPTGGGLTITTMSGPSGVSTLLNVTFSNNEATGEGGGGLYNASRDLVLANVTFSGNSATNKGGGMYIDSASSKVTNATFSGNSAGYGGGVYYSNGDPTIQNSILWGNTAGTAGAQIYNSGSTPTISTSVVADNGDGGCPTGSLCTGIITADPKLGVLGAYGGSTQTIPLLPGSSAIDTGNGTICAAAVGSPAYGAGGKDQRGVTRPLACDIGAFEFLYQIFLPLVFR